LADYQPNFSAVLMAVNIDAFQPLAQFRDMADRLVAATKEARRAPGVEEILVPGEMEWKTLEKRSREGLDLLDVTWQRIVDAGARHGVAVTL
jgi:LDH2 family malate/lactate/ureidoglycolate dehydrogenase